MSVPAIEFLSDKSLRGCFYGSGHVAAELPGLAELALAGRIDLAGAVSRLAPLDGVQEALDRLRRGEGSRTVLVLDEELAGVQVSEAAWGGAAPHPGSRRLRAGDARDGEGQGRRRRRATAEAEVLELRVHYEQPRPDRCDRDGEVEVRARRDGVHVGARPVVRQLERDDLVVRVARHVQVVTDKLDAVGVRQVRAAGVDLGDGLRRDLDAVQLPVLSAPTIRSADPASPRFRSR